jgi:putative membrane protein
MSVTEKSINRDLLLRENLAIQRTVLANQTTFLSFLRTSMYFLVAGLSIKNLLEVEGSIYYQVPLYVISVCILIFGIVNYFRHRRIIELSKGQVGDFKMDYLESKPNPENHR